MLVNPISFRISVSLFWKFTWSLYKYSNYKYLFYSDLVFFEYFIYFFKKLLKSKKSDFYLSHIRLYRLKKKLIVNIYYYNPSETVLYDQLKKKYLKKKKKIKKKIKILKTKKKRIKFWKKKTKIKFWKRIFFFKKKYLKKHKFKKILLLKEADENLLKINKLYKIRLLKNKNYFFKKMHDGRIRILTMGEVKNHKKLKKKQKLNYFLKKRKRNKKIKKIKKKIKNIKFKLNKKKKRKTYLLKKKKQKSKKEKRKKEKRKKGKRKKIIVIKKKKILKKKKIKKKKKLNKKNIKKLLKIKKIILKKNKKVIFLNKIYDKKYMFIYKLYIKKFLYNFKFLIYNVYIYILGVFLKKENKINFNSIYMNIKINLFQISISQITAKIVGKYLKTTLQKNYSVWKGLSPVIADLKKRILLKEISGFKIAYSGRFKRAQRATYLWRKEGHFLIGTPSVSIDYEVFLYKTKYGVCAIKIWITTGQKMFKYFQKIFPIFKLFYFLKKKDYFLLLKNNLFFNIFLKKIYISYSTFNIKFFKNILKNILYKYLYTNIFLKNLILKKKKYKILKNWRLILLPQYCLYKISLENYLNIKFLKIIPFINVKILKRINIRSSYKIIYLKKKNSKLKNILYKLKI